MAYPMPGVPFILDTDPSSYAIEALLSQVLEGEERAIAYCCRALTRPVWNCWLSLRHFHQYLYGRQFTIQTYHSALCWLFNFREPKGQIARWVQSFKSIKFCSVLIMNTAPVLNKAMQTPFLGDQAWMTCAVIVNLWRLDRAFRLATPWPPRYCSMRLRTGKPVRKPFLATLWHCFMHARS